MTARESNGISARIGLPSWAIVAAVAAVLLSGVVGWILATVLTTQHDTTTAGHESPVHQAKAQACNAFRLAGRQWTGAYRDWLPAITKPGWQWGDPTVMAATLKFSATVSEVAMQLNILVPRNTPPEIARAINVYTGALLQYSAAHLNATEEQMSALETDIDDAVDDLSRLCQ